MKKYLAVIIASLGILSLIASLAVVGCASLQTGSNSIVVRAEQTESGALATFNFVVNADDSNRSFWLTNAPAFHNFAEWLRQPLTNNGVMYRRGLWMVKQLDDAKLTYKANTSESNVLINAINDLESAKVQANAWYIIATTKAQ